MFYERRIVYLDCLTKGERCGSAGFMKIEARGTMCNLTINISGLNILDSFLAKVRLIAADREAALCEMKITQGKGVKCFLQQDMQDIGQTGIGYEELEAVRISIGTEREICGILREHVEAAELTDERFGAENTVKDVGEGNAAGEGNIVEEGNPVEVEQLPLQDNKWKQLWNIYPHIRPFQDEREYLSVGPNDFVILPYRHFRLANNSFLLHGYHNYRHLILKKLEYKGETRYYIGVPGNFYEREKQVAIMFGFESFECPEEPARAGDYGYYLMRVEL